MDRAASPDRELLDAAAENLVLHMTWVQARVAGMHASVDGSLAVADSGLDSDTFNTVCRARLGPNDGGLVRETVARFRDAGRPFSWWTGPGDAPPELPRMLEDAGLAAAESESGMAAELRRLSEIAPGPAGLAIERVATVEQLRTFAAINAANWSPPDAAVLDFYDRASVVLLAANCPLWLYVGYIDGEAAATAEVAVSESAAGLYNVSTLAAYRRRGIGLAMTLRPLVDARAAGVRLGILQASREGGGVYRRAGFEVFGSYQEYKPVASG